MTITAIIVRFILKKPTLCQKLSSIIMIVHYSHSKATFLLLFTTLKGMIKRGGGKRGNMQHGIHVLKRKFWHLYVKQTPYGKTL